MEWVLLAVAVFVLVFNPNEDQHDYTEVQAHGRVGPDQADAFIAEQVRAAETAITTLTDEAVLAMLDEARAWQPGGHR